MALKVALVGWRADQGSNTSAVPAEDRVRQQAERVAVALHPCTTMNRPTSAVYTVEPPAGNVQAGAPRVDGSDLTIDVLRERRLFRRAHMEALLPRPGNCLSEYAITLDQVDACLIARDRRRPTPLQPVPAVDSIDQYLDRYDACGGEPGPDEPADDGWGEWTGGGQLPPTRPRCGPTVDSIVRTAGAVLT